MLTIVLLICSNVFMTIAWYGHLKFKAWPLIVAIFVSWLIALPEYMLQVPANRYGHADEAELAAEANQTSPRHWWQAEFSAPQLKILQEIITISVFVLFNFVYLRETIRRTDWAAFALIVLAVVVMMYPRIAGAPAEATKPSGAVSMLPEDVAMQPLDDGKRL